MTFNIREPYDEVYGDLTKTFDEYGNEKYSWNGAMSELLNNVYFLRFEKILC